jgi:hypothetical protein
VLTGRKIDDLASVRVHELDRTEDRAVRMIQLENDLRTVRRPVRVDGVSFEMREPDQVRAVGLYREQLVPAPARLCAEQDQAIPGGVRRADWRRRTNAERE